MSNFINEFLKYFLTNPLIITILILGLISAIFYKQIVGWFGEHWTKKALSRLPKKQIYEKVLIEFRYLFGYSNY